MYIYIYILWCAGQEEDEKRAGATATVVLARRDKLVVANVGDSRAVLSRRWAPSQPALLVPSLAHSAPACRTRRQLWGGTPQALQCRLLAGSEQVP